MGLILYCTAFGALSYLCMIKHGSAEATFTPVKPPTYPLAARNPYLSAWLSGDEAADLPSANPEFWTGQKLNWSVIARVDGTPYGLLGVPSSASGIKAAVLQSAQYTTTHTVFSLTAGQTNITLDFFSPVSPGNYIRQSLPFSYLTVSTYGNNDATPNVQIYSDIDTSWTGHIDDGGSISSVQYVASNSTHISTMTPANAANFTEVSDMAQWGKVAYCTRPSNSNVTSQFGKLSSLRGLFSSSGASEQLIDDSAQGGVAYSHDLGIIGQNANVTFVVGLVRNPDVNYLGAGRRDYWVSECNGEDEIACGCVLAFQDFEDADAESHTIDSVVSSKATSVGGAKYSDILTLSVRQAFMAMDLTIPADTLDTTDVLAFLKEISSDGNVNTVDVIFPMLPLFYVMAPEWIQLVTEPVMRYLATGRWNVNFTIHDIGSSYPNATGHDDGYAEPMPLEECGNIILTAYMYRNATGDTAWAAQYKPLFQEYADYLVESGLYPDLQLSSDDGAGSIANQTHLAIKAAIALNAYGLMFDQANYSAVGLDFADRLYNQKLGTDAAQTHFTLSQGNDTTWTTAYNLFLDVLLNLNTFPTEAYAMQTSFYPSVRAETGVPLDNRVDWAKTDWMMFAAGTAMASGVKNVTVRDMFVDDLHAFVVNGKNTAPFGDKFVVSGEKAGEIDGYRARPVVGGHFALLAMRGANQIRVGGG